jgi:hypothetical protein
MRSTAQRLTKPGAAIVPALIRMISAAGLASLFALSVSVPAHSRPLDDTATAAALDSAIRSVPGQKAFQIPASESAHRATKFGGDYGLDAATVVEQQFTGYTRYTLQLKLASGAEQSIAVAAPPGGLQLKMLDMTGDNVPNDLILIPAQVRWPLTVLVNDGDGHFSVAISGDIPGFFGNRGNLASSSRHVHSVEALLSSGFKSIGPAYDTAFFPPQLELETVFNSPQASPERSSYLSGSGRAPPTSEA